MVGLWIGEDQKDREGCRGAQLPVLTWEGVVAAAGQMSELPKVWLVGGAIIGWLLLAEPRGKLRPEWHRRARNAAGVRCRSESRCRDARGRRRVSGSFSGRSPRILRCATAVRRRRCPSTGLCRPLTVSRRGRAVARVNSVEVNWQPWSVLKISGVPWAATARWTARTQKLASSVLDSSQASTQRLCQSMTAQR